MNVDQYRVRITVTVHEGANANVGRRSSVVERMEGDGGTLDSIQSFIEKESIRLFNAARRDVRNEQPEATRPAEDADHD
jgi:hypothetical protein